MFKIALGNVIKNKRRSFFNVLAVTVGIFIIIVFLGWYRGVADTMKQSMIDFETGNIQIYNVDYMEQKRKIPLKYNIDIDSRNDITGFIPANQLLGISERIDFNSSISFEGKTLRLMGRAIVPEEESKITPIDKYLVEGKSLKEKKGILIGKKNAEKLGVKVGDKLYIKAVDRYSVTNMDFVEIVGLFNFGFPQTDNNMFFIDMDTAGQLLSMEGLCTSIVVKVANDRKKASYIDELNKFYSGKKIQAYPWEDFARVLVTQIEGDYAAMMYMLVIMCILIAFGIFNTISMSIQEREREIGTLRAIGMRKSVIRKIFLYESFLLGLGGIIIAFLLSFLISLYLGGVGVDVAKYMPENYPIPIGSNLKSNFMIGDYMLGAFVGLVISLIGGILPVRKVLNKSTADTLRSVIG